MNLKDRLLPRIIHEESMRLFPYLDCCGKPWRECACQEKGNLTIAAGVNIDAGITEDEGVYLTGGRLDKAMREAETFDWFDTLDIVRQEVVVDMIFNMGLADFKAFKRMIAALEKKDYHIASAEMMNSVWKNQVGDRAMRLSKMMWSGEEAV